MTTTEGVAPEAGREADNRWTMAKNAAAALLAVAIWLALDTGYLSPDRPTRAQWERLEKARQAKDGTVVYEADFARDGPGGGKSSAGSWGFYNGATTATVKYDASGVTITYGGTPWIGAVLTFRAYEPGRLYRVTVERTATGEPGALLVRNRQLDLVRSAIPVGTGPFAVEFVAPPGRLDRVDVAFIPDNRTKPAGSLRISAAKIERLE